ncbi:ATP-binding protein [Terrimonas pollutisoli]|uniref:ATP-binding protein n=1 Tax=Terrimonas pollutisoli TaxID=3034147 RepID=UPI0023EBF4F5|nr:ATP-binding protein [Terrimonas sp. H1YJ31]
MILPGTEMHIITFIFVCIEMVILFYLLIYRLARPDDKKAYLNIILISLLIFYNVSGGLLPDPNLPGSYFLQASIAYAAGFITPCFFPYYVYKAFDLEKMKFHAYRGVYLFLIFPYLIFVAVLGISNDLDIAKYLLIIPVVYAVWVIYSLAKAIRFKYKNNFTSKESKEEVAVLFLSLTPWVGLPVIDFFNLGQAVEASLTNVGFLLLLALQVKRHIIEMRREHQSLIESEKRLLNWNTSLKNEVDKRTRELEKINEQRANTFVNLAHETKTPLTLINNYLDDFIARQEKSEELTFIKRNLDKLTADVVNLFDLERFNKGFNDYSRSHVSNFSEILKDSLVLFRQYSNKKNIQIKSHIQDDLLIKANPISINRIINNLMENAIKFSMEGSAIDVVLHSERNKITFSVRDYGIGIPAELHKKVFTPYYQIANPKRNNEGMGLGLPITKKVIDDLNGSIQIISDPQKVRGTELRVILNQHTLLEKEFISANFPDTSVPDRIEKIVIHENIFDPAKQSILLVEDNPMMINYLFKKLNHSYNIYTALNGNEALRKLRALSTLPDLIITDVMMDKVDGYKLAEVISKDITYNHIPFIFISAKSEKSDVLHGLGLGAIDFVQKPFSIQELLQKVKSILTNSSRQKRAIFSAAFNSLSKSVDRDPVYENDKFEKSCELYNLTSREIEVARLICKGLPHKEIGESLFISERTVAKHSQNIFEKVRVSNRLELSHILEV